NCTLDDSDPPKTRDVVYPCPWGSMNDGPYDNGDEMECGNSVVDRGEDCDPADSTYDAFIPAETCTSLGHGPGSLGCTAYPRACTWDTSGCTAKTCTQYGRSTVRLLNVLGGPGDDQLFFTARDIPGASFDPQ